MFSSTYYYQTAFAILCRIFSEVGPEFLACMQDNGSMEITYGDLHAEAEILGDQLEVTVTVKDALASVSETFPITDAFADLLAQYLSQRLSLPISSIQSREQYLESKIVMQPIESLNQVTFSDVITLRP